MVKTKMEFQAVFQAMFPGIKTIEQVEKSFHGVVESIEYLHKAINTFKYKMAEGLIPKDVGTKSLANLRKGLTEQRKQLAVLGDAVTRVYDPQTKHVANSKHITEELEKQLAITEALAASGLNEKKVAEGVLSARKAIAEAMQASGIGKTMVPKPYIRGAAAKAFKAPFKAVKGMGAMGAADQMFGVKPGKGAAVQAAAMKATGDYVGRVVARYKEWKKKQEKVNEEAEKTVRIKNKIEKAIEKIGKKVSGMAKRMRRVSRTIRAWGRNFLWLGRDITIFTSMAIGAAVKSTAMWAKFAEQVQVTQRVIRRREKRQEAGGKEFPSGWTDFEAGDMITGAGVMGQVMAAGDAMAISISAAVMSFGHLVRAGYQTGEALEVSAQAMILNRGSMISLADATDMMITIQKNFSKEVYNAAKIADIMTVADMNAVASMSELQSGMGFVSGTAARMGMSLEQTAAAMVLLTNAGFSGSVAGRELRSVLNNVMQNAEDYGIKIKDATGEMMPFEAVLSSVEDRMGYFGTELERTQFLQEVFGETNVSMVQALLRNRDELSKLTNELDDSGDAAEKAATIMQQTLEFRLDQLRTGFEKVQLAIGKGFAEALVGGENFLESLAGTLNMMLPLVEKAAYSFGVGFVESLQWWVTAAQATIDVALDLAGALGLLKGSVDESADAVSMGGDKVSFLGENMGKVAGFALVAGPAMIGVGIALEILSPIMFTLSAAVTGLSFAISGLGFVVSVVSGILGAFGAVAGFVGGILGAPIIIPLLAIAAVILILIGFVQGIMEVFDELKGVLEPGLTVVLDMIAFIFSQIWTVVELVIGVLLRVIDIFIKIGKVIAGVVVIGLKILDFFGVLDIVAIGISMALAVVVIALEALAFVIKILLIPLDLLVGFLDWILGLLFGESPGLIPGIQEFGNVLGGLTGVLDIASGALQLFGDIAQGAVNLVFDAVGAAAEGISGFIQGVVSDILPSELADPINSVIEGVENVVTSSVDAVQGVINASIDGLQTAVDGIAKGAGQVAEGDILGGLVTMGQGVTEGAIDVAQSVAQGSIDMAQAGLEGVANVAGEVADSVGGLVCGFLGCSPGLIPALDQATIAMQRFGIEAENLKSKNITVAATLGGTNKELQAMVSHNFDTWNEMVGGQGREVVELGADTMRALKEILMREEDWSWSEGAAAPMAETPKAGGRGRIVNYGGMSPR